MTFVGQNVVRASPERQNIRARSGDDGIQSVLQHDRVISPVAEIDGLNRLNAAVGEECGLAIVTENRVRAATRRDLIHTGSTDDRVRAAGESNRVGSPAREVGTFDAEQSACVTEDHLTIVAQNNGLCVG